jgi:uncharacterized RDD family membrane protein YckC
LSVTEIPQDQGTEARIPDSPVSAVLELETSDTPWQLTPVAPWRRYGARMLDTLFTGAGGWFFLSLAFYAVAPTAADEFFNLISGRLERFADIMLTVFVAFFINSLLMTFIGTTPGKAIFGIKVLTKAGQRLTMSQCFLREADVWLRGLAIGFPLLSLFTMILSFRRLREKSVTYWDHGRYMVMYRRPGTRQTWLNILGVVLILLTRGLLIFLASMPE